MNIPESVAASNGTLRISDSTREHLLAHPDIESVFLEAASKLVLPEGGAFCAQAVDLGRVVGETACVSVEKIDMDTPAWFAIRVNRPRPSRVAVGVAKIPTQHVAFIAGAAEDSTDAQKVYDLYTCWVGKLAPKEPGDAKEGAEFDQAFGFWCEHALVYEEGEGIYTEQPQRLTWRRVLMASRGNDVI